MASSQRIALLSQSLIDLAKANGKMIATAESCTGGLITAALTDISGSSSVVDRGFVTYTNEAKAEMLDVPTDLIDRHGAVSGQVAHAMARGALASSNADIAVSVTGIAGPTGGSADKPVGLVWFGLATKNNVRTERRLFARGSRDFVRARSVETALRLLISGLRD